MYSQPLRRFFFLLLSPLFPAPGSGVPPAVAGAICPCSSEGKSVSKIMKMSPVRVRPRAQQLQAEEASLIRRDADEEDENRLAAYMPYMGAGAQHGTKGAPAVAGGYDRPITQLRWQWWGPGTYTHTGVSLANCDGRQEPQHDGSGDTSTFLGPIY